MCAIDRMVRPVSKMTIESEVPYSAVKYTGLDVSTEQSSTLHKLRLPKTIRWKLIVFMLLLGLPLLLFSAFCFQSCDGVTCPGMCNFSKLKPSLTRILSSNFTNVHYPHTSRHLPKCIIIGVRKSGTRALLKYLSIHPNIVTVNKELHFFNMDDHYSLGYEYYRKQMPYTFKEQITIEKTPAYFTEAKVPERIYRMNKSIQLLLIVREPVTRLVSDYAQLREVKITRNKSVASFENEVLDKDGEVNIRYKGVRTSIYANYLRSWMTFFPYQQIHIVDGEKLISDPFVEIFDVETFLGIEHRITRDQFFFNKSKGFYCVQDSTLKSSCLQKTKGREHPEVDQKVIQTLYQFYRPYNKVFFSMINKTFNWQ